MPLKTEQVIRRSIEVETDLPCAPEQVWQAVATGRGNEAWFTRAQIEERVGGKIEFDFGDGLRSVGIVSHWEPPRKFGYIEVGWHGDAPPIATEIVIEPRSSDRSRLRMVHYLFTGCEDWDAELESFETGWPAFFAVLKIHLEAFSGEPVALGRMTTTYQGDEEAAWGGLSRLLGLEGLQKGERRDTSVNGAPQLAGTVEYIGRTSRDHSIALRLTEPAPGVALIGTCQAGEKSFAAVSFYLYGSDAASIEARETPKWRAWLKQHFRMRDAG